MRARIIRSNFEVDVQPYYQDGWFVGFTATDTSGLILYKPQDLVFPDTPEATDYFRMRMEAAKDILCAIVSHTGFNYHDPDQFTADAIAAATVMADSLIKKLKEEQKCMNLNL